MEEGVLNWKTSLLQLWEGNVLYSFSLKQNKFCTSSSWIKCLFTCFCVFLHSDNAKHVKMWRYCSRMNSFGITFFFLNHIVGPLSEPLFRSFLTWIRLEILRGASLTAAAWQQEPDRLLNSADFVLSRCVQFSKWGITRQTQHDCF